MATIASVVYSAFDDAPIITVNTADTSFTYHFFDTTNTEIDNGVGVDGDSIIESVGDTGNYRFTAIDSLTTVSTAAFRYNPTTHIISLLVITNGGSISMATGSGREYTATQRAHTVGQRYFDIKGNGPTEDAAIIELGRKVTLGHGSVVLLGRPRISVVMADADFNGDTGALGAGGYAARVAARDSAGEQENVQITLEQTFDAGTIDERVETATIRIAACSDSIKLAGTAVNDIDPANAKVTAFVTAYYDGDGNNGYQFRSGKFVR